MAIWPIKLTSVAFGVAGLVLLGSAPGCGRKRLAPAPPPAISSESAAATSALSSRPTTSALSSRPTTSALSSRPATTAPPPQSHLVLPAPRTANVEPSAEAPAPVAEPTTEASASPPRIAMSTSVDACPAVPLPKGFDECDSVELTGAAPCELVCQRPRASVADTKCCEGPVQAVVLSGQRTLLQLPLCSITHPRCADVHGHGNMSSHLRYIDGSPTVLVVVEGGCEMRAVGHGYVPSGVAAWTGCKQQRHQWNGRVMKRTKAP